MSYERIMGIYVADHLEYQKYRDAMLPVLSSYGGSLGFDFKVSEVLASKSGGDINRVFTLEFPSKEVMERFFNDKTYLEVKARHFDKSVTSRTVISMHSKNA